MSVFTATFADQAVSAEIDLFDILAGEKRLAIRRLVVGQYSDAGDAEAENLGVRLLRGYTTAGSGGSSVTPQNIDSGGPVWTTRQGTVTALNTTLAQDGSPATVWADVWNIAAGLVYPPAFPPAVLLPPEKARLIIVQPNQRLVVRQTVPSDALTMNGTIELEEIG